MLLVGRLVCSSSMVVATAGLSMGMTFDIEEFVSMHLHYVSVRWVLVLAGMAIEKRKKKKQKKKRKNPSN